MTSEVLPLLSGGPAVLREDPCHIPDGRAHRSTDTHSQTRRRVLNQQLWGVLVEPGLAVIPRWCGRRQNESLMYAHCARTGSPGLWSPHDHTAIRIPAESKSDPLAMSKQQGRYFLQRGVRRLCFASKIHNWGTVRRQRRYRADGSCLDDGWGKLRRRLEQVRGPRKPPHGLES